MAHTRKSRHELRLKSHVDLQAKKNRAGDHQQRWIGGEGSRAKIPCRLKEIDGEDLREGRWKGGKIDGLMIDWRNEVQGKFK